MIHILIVDNEKSPREKLQTLLEQQPNLQVVCTVKNGYAALEKITNIYPDIVDKLLERDRSSLQQLEKDLETTKVKATADGIIAKLNLRNPGQTVRLGEEIAQIVPINSALEIKAQITPQNISKVQLEQPVDIRISACPYPDYGTLSGVVSKISADALTVERNQTILPFKGN